MRLPCCALALATFLFAIVELQAASVSFDRAGSTVSVEAVAAGAPAGGHVADFFVTTDADILSYRRVQLTQFPDGRPANLFDVAPPFGSNIAPPPSEYIALNRSLEFDSWVTTPGSTSWVVPPNIDVGPWYPGAVYEDQTDDGPQNMFHFARLAFLPGNAGLFSGEIVVSGETGPESFPFSFPIGVPEPSGLALACLGVIWFGFSSSNVSLKDTLMRYSAFLIALVVSVDAALESWAASSEFSRLSYPVTPEMIDSGVPEGAPDQRFFCHDQRWIFSRLEMY